ncbi:MAG TPA: anti-phage deoxyguanosine triphosphatase [Gemmatimonadaceae bacterium]|nr:anti-phage deoxyguanosine triphosphatase [Gemmatimonadaceae bacterium]
MERWLEDRRSGSTDNRVDDDRPPYDRDRARIIHTAAFRRLQAKTQVVGIGYTDFTRTRLTHSLEAAQISRGLRAKLVRLRHPTVTADILPPVDLLEAICLSHDIGHPPFGHAGERVLDYLMRDAGGFEGNGQTLRQLAALEAHHPTLGLDLTRRALAGVLKYPAPYSAIVAKHRSPPAQASTVVNFNEWKPPKCYFDVDRSVVEWVLEPFLATDRSRFVEFEAAANPEGHGRTKHTTLDASILNLADDIAYGVHDLEDGVALGEITRTDFDRYVPKAERESIEWWRRFQMSDGVDLLFGKSGDARKNGISVLVNGFIQAASISEENGFTHPLLRFRAALQKEAEETLRNFKKLVHSVIVLSQAVQTLEFRGAQIARSLAEAIFSDPRRLMKPGFVAAYDRETDAALKQRIICDYIAGMTDEYATRLYERLFIPRSGALFEQF